MKSFSIASPQVSKEVGVKYDQGKLRFSLLPWIALREIVKVLMYGASKYTDRNWERGIVFSRLYDATIRHLNSWWEDREEADPETGLSHLAHAGCNILFLITYVVRGTVLRTDDGGASLDDRPVYTINN